MNLERVAEDELVMESSDSVSAFDGAGEPGGPLFPIYHFNATALSQLLPQNSVVLDVFCGSAQFLTYLLKGRADLQAIGLDLSQSMLDLAAANLEAAGLESRVQLVKADAAIADETIAQDIHAVSCLSALHHCPRPEDLVAVLSSIQRLRERNGCAVWLFDLVRPEKESMLQLIPRIHEISMGKSLDAAFKKDWITSLRAGWTFEEFKHSLESAGMLLTGANANNSQLHWAGMKEPAAEVPDWDGPTLDARDLSVAIKLANAMGWSHLG